MEQAVDSFNPRKRTAQDLVDEPPSSKRSCADESSASPCISLLEDLYDLEAEDEEAAIDAPLASSPQEDLVAEMMKSLEKVIGEGEDGAALTSNPSPATSPSLDDFTWGNEEIQEYQNSSFHGELVYEEDLKEDVQIRKVLQASDDELGLPLSSSSSSSSDVEESLFHEEWASLAEEGSAPVNFNWMDASFHHFEDGPFPTKEIFEPLLLF